MKTVSQLILASVLTFSGSWILTDPAKGQAQNTGTGTELSVNGQASQINSSRKRLQIVRTDLVPVIDGVLDDEIWKVAAVISDMHQFQPVDHGEPTEQSIFYLAYTERFLYIGARLYDTDPSGISARQMMQGQGMPFDDAFEIILDTFNNGRTGYYFQVNPNGIRAEGVYENPNNLNRDWTGIWQVESRVDEQGWTAEMAIPFTTLNFDPNTEEWGFTIARTIARKQEELAWSSFNRTLNPTTTGIIYGITDIRQGKGLDIIPSMTMGRSENFVAGTNGQRFDPSLDIFYKVTPNLTGALTLNTDFSATEVDNRQVNLTRFSLFFPEKRDFFLQDVDIFSFGGRGTGNNFNSQNGIPFYSRRIGLGPGGQPLDIDAGLKLTGRVGPWNVGALAVQQGDTPGLEGQSVFVGRVSANVLSESSLGAIFTHGDPNSVRGNSLAGADFRYQNTRFSSTHTMRGNLWYQQSETEGLQGDSKAYGASVNFDNQNNGVGGTVNYAYFGQDYNPALGFANQTGVQVFGAGGQARYFLRGHPVIRVLNAFGRIEHTRLLATDELLTENIFFRPMNINTHRGDQFGIGYGRNREGLQRDFRIRPGIVIPAGTYTFANYNMDINISNQRVFAPRFQMNIGDFYAGTRKRYNTSFELRPNEHIYLNVGYDYQDIDLPQGEFDVKIISANVNYAFNSKWSWVNLIQYDNASSSAGVNSRIRWNPQAGEDLYIVINYNFDSLGVFNDMSPAAADFALKYTKTFRF
jgi:hypothetical protein